MAVTVQMNSDIRKYTPKFFGPFSKRQCIAVGVAIGLAVPVFLLTDGWVIDYRIIAMISAAMPAIVCGFIKFGRMPMEIFFMRYAYSNFLTPRKRKYKTENIIRQEYKKINKSNNEKSKKEKIVYSKNFKYYK